MGIVSRQSIAIPAWVIVGIALAVAAVLTLVAFLLTSDRSASLGGKAIFTGAILVLPLVLGAKSEWPPGLSFAFAFISYFSVSFAAVWLFTRERLNKTGDAEAEHQRLR